VPEQPSPVLPHVWHVCPSTAHARPVGGSVHTFPVQQPAAHDVGVHSHEPFMHTCPATQAAPAPHRQPPEGEQLSASPDGHVVHMLPSVPQLPGLGVTQLPLLQHPLGQDAELHTHCPLTHCWPGEHAAPPPQLQAPAVHPSATKAVHDVHALPEMPQVPGDGASQLAPAQQPDAQLAAVHEVHVLFTQFCCAGQGEQLDPPEPQAPLDVPARQVLFEQQPLAQDVPSQMQAPFTQRWPLAHAAPVLPQVHVPLLVQVSAVAPHVPHVPPAVPQVVRVWASHTPLLQQPFGQEVALQVHVPPTHAWPCAHSLPPPHEQEPELQPFERVVSQAAHAAPAVPQVLSVLGVMQVTPPWQQPLAHEAALQTHFPATHC
jgi:hypothetical protein